MCTAAGLDPRHRRACVQESPCTHARTQRTLVAFWKGKHKSCAPWTPHHAERREERHLHFQAPSAPLSSPLLSSRTFWEANDCVQWYRTSLSLLKGLGSAVGSSHSSPSAAAAAAILPSSSMAEMGHQLQLVGVTWLEDAMTERFVCVCVGEERGARRERRGEGVEGSVWARARVRVSSASRASSPVQRQRRQRRQHPSDSDSSGAESRFSSEW